MTYDSTQETKEHIGRVQELVAEASTRLGMRALAHDRSKLQSPEKEGFDKYTPLLRDTVYGSDEYKVHLAGLREVLAHHYAENSHHPEHYENGVDGMSLLDLLEMLLDWKAASERHETGDIHRSIDINEDRFKLTPQLASILRNTVKEFNW